MGNDTFCNVLIMSAKRKHIMFWVLETPEILTGLC